VTFYARKSCGTLFFLFPGSFFADLSALLKISDHCWILYLFLKAYLSNRHFRLRTFFRTNSWENFGYTVWVHNSSQLYFWVKTDRASFSEFPPFRSLGFLCFPNDFVLRGFYILLSKTSHLLPIRVNISLIKKGCYSNCQDRTPV